MQLGVRLFVLAVFSILGLSFVAVTAVLMWEFGEQDGLTLATFYSHLFVFFPTLGLVTLLALYTPACAFHDMYWRHIRYGKVRFSIGFIVVAIASWYGAQLITGNERSVFEVTPAALHADRGEPAGCETGRTCARLPVMPAVKGVREVSQSRIGLGDLSRNCRLERLIETMPAELQKKRFCFATTVYKPNVDLPLSTDRDCCAAQRQFGLAIKSMYADPAQHSMTGQVHRWLLPLKIFFMLVLLAISLLLVYWRGQLETFYPAHMGGIERGLLIGALAMVIFPAMSHAFLQSAGLLYGSPAEIGYRAIGPAFTFAFGVWALLILFFMYRRRDKEIESLARVSGICAGAIATLKYDVIVDFFVRIFGSGASRINLMILAACAVVAVIALYVRTSEELSIPEAQSEVEAGDSASG